MRLKFTLPLYAFFPSGAAVLLFLVFLAGSNWLGYTHCWDWTKLQTPPERAARFIDGFKDRVFLQTVNGDVYCYTQGTWKKCVRSAYPPELHSAPDWLMSRFVSIPAAGTIVQLIRVTHFMDSTYYALSDSGELLSCSITFEDQARNMVQSGAIVLLIAPMVLGVWAFMEFMKIFARDAQPVYVDFWGRRFRVK